MNNIKYIVNKDIHLWFIFEVKFVCGGINKF